jgi:hypothetical protein
MESSFEGIRSACCPDTLPENPCIVCPDGITAGDYFAPFAEDFGDTTTSREYVDSALGYKAESLVCTVQNRVLFEPLCCPATPENSCIMCPDGATDDFAPHAEFGMIPWTCKEIMDMFKTFEEESNVCEMSQYALGGGCCPTTVEDPCIACPNGITVGDDFAPYAGSGYPMPCSKIIEQVQFLDAGHSLCVYRDWDEALCCPAAPKNPCNICPYGITAADDFFPPDELQTCKQIIDTLMLIETVSDTCSDWGPSYKVLCCPIITVTATSVIEETSTVATPTGIAITASTSSGATSTSVMENPKLTTTTTEPTSSGGVTVSELTGFAFIIAVSALSSIALA